ncbi:hypothetical protein O2N63_06230 [Aliiroseovarius sp. KMU-50]|uniref:Uncharacterized protein n=1 Tax=Aliiroseovarius salicola TaxID=3009082 RepID=A0ABT4VZP4_9RHOB|nr:hypothetical protein [Aliiroseovarius sp. KMU-50]MDA5093681.1 hypothetical protein [Aliiroseovarius sp. KMU-50]
MARVEKPSSKQTFVTACSTVYYAACGPRMPERATFCHNPVTTAKLNGSLPNFTKLNFPIKIIALFQNTQFGSFPFTSHQSPQLISQIFIAHGMQEVSGSTPLGSTKSLSQI